MLLFQGYLSFICLLLQLPHLCSKQWFSALSKQNEADMLLMVELLDGHRALCVDLPESKGVLDSDHDGRHRSNGCKWLRQDITYKYIGKQLLRTSLACFNYWPGLPLHATSRLHLLGDSASKLHDFERDSGILMPPGGHNMAQSLL